MKGAYRLTQSRKKSIAIQRLHLKMQTNGSCASKTPSQIRWIYTTRPSAFGREYKVLIHYKLGKSPNVFVLSPHLFGLTDDYIPHLYRNKKDEFNRSSACLCLYRYKYGEWNAEKIIADAILPWVDLWLLYFEYWMVTGSWEGGGEHPE